MVSRHSDYIAAELRRGVRDDASKKSLVLFLTLTAALAFVLFFRIGASPPANEAEQRVEGVVRQMVSSGDWLVPRLDGEVRLQKPPGYYWVGAALSSVVGETSWASVRAGSAIATLLLVAVTFVWGSAIGGPRLGITAAVCLASMHYTIAFGRRTMADSTLSLFSTLALASFDRFEFGRRRTWIAAFAVALTGAILAKATAALLVVGLPIALWLLLDPPSRDGTLPDLARASLLALAGGFLWYGVVIATLPGALHDILTEAALPLGLQLDPAAQSARHYAWPHALVGPLVVGSLPAGVFIPLLVRRSVESRFYRAAPRLRFVGIAFI